MDFNWGVMKHSPREFLCQPAEYVAAVLVRHASFVHDHAELIEGTALCKLNGHCSPIARPLGNEIVPEVMCLGVRNRRLVIHLNAANSQLPARNAGVFSESTASNIPPMAKRSRAHAPPQATTGFAHGLG